MLDLFVSETLIFAKTAAAELEEDATQWPRQVLTELFRVLPEISEYTPEVRFLRTNEEQGYAIGVVVVTNSTNSALASQQATTAQSPKALIPVVVKNGKLMPIDTLMTSSGKMLPLTVERLREALYRPEGFELITDDWGDAALWQLFAPPGRDFNGSAGGLQVMTGPGLKQASLLSYILPTVLRPDLDALGEALAEDVALKKAAMENPAMSQALVTLCSVPGIGPEEVEDLEDKLASAYSSDVHQFVYDEGTNTYTVKSANRSFGVQRVTEGVTRRELIETMGDKLAAAVDTAGSITLAEPTERAVVVSGPKGENPKIIQRSGCYTVFDAITGAEQTGCVVTGLIDAKGNRNPVFLFFNEHGAITQDQIAGIRAYGEYEEMPMPSDPPRGIGCFVIDHHRGDHEATVPLTVSGSSGDGTSVRYSCTDLTGKEMTIVLQRDVRSIVAFPARSELVMPHNTKFVSLDRELPPLVRKGEDTEKVASALLAGSVYVSSAPDDLEHYRITSRNLPKLASVLPRGDVSWDDAVFALCIAGLGRDDAVCALNKVASSGRCEVRAHDIAAPNRAVDNEKIAASVSEVRALRPHLLKEAAVLPDVMTVDAVLSLDFINSENVRTFIAMIPYLEKALTKICELVFASRLGLSEIPENAAARAARGLNDTIRGLKALALRQIDELP